MLHRQYEIPVFIDCVRSWSWDPCIYWLREIVVVRSLYLLIAWDRGRLSIHIVSSNTCINI